jgi:hypothetical protein
MDAKEGRRWMNERQGTKGKRAKYRFVRNYLSIFQKLVIRTVEIGMFVHLEPETMA